MPGVTAEQVEKAREWDLLSYLKSYEPQELKPSGPNEYRTVTHGSLVIHADKWYWNRGGFGGYTALDYLMKVRQVPFVEAVETLCDGRAPSLSLRASRPEPEKEQKPFVLPEASRFANRAIQYLHGRGIAPEVIARCLETGILYESRKYHNCVFVGRDASGSARFACLRSTQGNFKQDVAGSDKRFNFCFEPKEGACATVAAFESPIDALSLATLWKNDPDMKGEWDSTNYLSLSGTSPKALLQYLNERPAVRHVYLCLDNDEAGLRGMEKISKAIENDPVLHERIQKIHVQPPPKKCGKDYNKMLENMLVEQTAGQLHKVKKHEER